MGLREGLCLLCLGSTLEGGGESGGERPESGEAGRGFDGEAGWWLRRAEVDLRSGWRVRGGVERVCSWGLGRGGASYFKGAAHLRGHTFQGCPELPNLTHRGGSLGLRGGTRCLCSALEGSHRSQARSREESRGDARIDLRVVSFDKTVMKQLLQGRMKPIVKPFRGLI